VRPFKRKPKPASVGISPSPEARALALRQNRLERRVAFIEARLGIVKSMNGEKHEAT